VLQITPDDEIVLGAESFTYLDLPRQALFVKEKQLLNSKFWSHSRKAHCVWPSVSECRSFA